MPGPRKSKLMSTLELDQVEGTDTLGLGFWAIGCWGISGAPIVCSGCNDQKKSQSVLGQTIFDSTHMIKNNVSSDFVEMILFCCNSSMVIKILGWPLMFANGRMTQVREDERQY